MNTERSAVELLFFVTPNNVHPHGWTDIGHGRKRATAGSNVSLVITGEDESRRKFQPGKTYFLYFCEGPHEKTKSNGQPAAEPARAARKGAHVA